MRIVHLFGLFILACPLFSQLYFPPLTGEEWESLDASTLSWCPERVDSLHLFLEETNAKGFIYLKDGRIVDEIYFNGFNVDSSWYWASAGKTLTSFLIGCAQSDGLLDIDAPTSDFLGEGWSSCTPEQEQAITIRHQLTMTTGLNYLTDDLNCIDPECLDYLNPPGEEWYYHNAPYRLLLDVLSSTSGQFINVHTNQRV